MRKNIYQKYLSQLKQNNRFNGDIATDFPTCLTMATDNSIYQVVPQAVCFPKNSSDIEVMMQLGARAEFLSVQFSPRGGGTGTNGQSLTAGIVIDCSRYMTRILEVDLDKGIVRVEPGVVLDQLNDHLRQHNMFFAPSLSTSSRATLGGMFATDACGKGSCCHGRTSDHVSAVNIVLANGEVACIDPNIKEYPKESRIEKVCHQVSTLIDENAKEIQSRFSHLPRHVTGYNLGKTKQQNQLNLNYLLSGSEGTLAIVTELTLKLTKLPTYTELVVIKYDSFDAALRSANHLLAQNPTAIETIDDKILERARKDIIYKHIQQIIDPGHNDTTTKAMSIVEFCGQDKTKISAQVSHLLAELKQENIGFYHTHQSEHISALWQLRKKSVGLLANLPGRRQPVPFVEDTIVPPKHLADYIAEFRALLSSYHLDYGMFGHPDAGCIHVRPALDMKNPDDAKLVPVITEKVYALVKKYRGMMWGEHGRGFRSEETQDYFGESLYHVLQEIKTLFDPYDQLNPGKIVTSLKRDQPLVTMKGPLRGEQDRQITPAMQAEFERVIRCNGNAACFQYSVDEVMCPSYLATRDRIQSPKGRSVLMREWLRLRSNHSTDIKNFSKAVYHAMSGCLGCKACATNCPVKVDIPEYKSEFLANYYQENRRPFKDYIVAYTEYLLPFMMKMPKFFNRLMRKYMLTKIGLVDLPKLAINTLKQGLHHRNAPKFSLSKLQNANPKKTVCLLVDPFVAAFQPSWALDIYDLLTKLGYVVYVLPIKPNGKPMHVKGFLKSFNQLAKKNNHFYAKINTLDIPMIGIDPAMTLCYRDEYQKSLGDQLQFKVDLLPQWLLSSQKDWHDRLVVRQKTKIYYLFSHCTEKALLASNQKDWIQLFSLFGLALKSVATGCCGMAGSFGHEAEHQIVSKSLFDMSWKDKIDQNALITGFSCAYQTSRFSEYQAEHPASALCKVLE